MAQGAPSVRPRSLSLSLAIHAVAVAAILLAAALGTPALPTPAVVAMSRPVIFDGAPIRLAPQPVPVRRGTRLPSPVRRAALASAPRSEDAVPTSTATTTPIQEVSDPGDAPVGATEGFCTQGCVLGTGDSIVGDPLGTGSAAEAVVKAGPGGDIRPPRKVRDVAPIYPDLAIHTRVEGRVEIECRIDTTGRVVDATVLRGHPLLVASALTAVREWLYQPTLLNGVPVSVIMTVTVHFRLQR
jgi:periplasmic protein TonB